MKLRLCSCGALGRIYVDDKTFCNRCYSEYADRYAVVTKRKLYESAKDYGMQKQPGETREQYNQRCKEWALGKSASTIVRKVTGDGNV